MRTGELHSEHAGHWAGIVAVLSLALGVRLAAVLWLSDTYPYSDYFYYHQAGLLSAEDWGLWLDSERILRLAKLSWWPPGYPMFLGMVYEVFGPDHRAAVFAHVILGTLTCGLVYAIARRALDARLALIAAALIALDPHYVFVTNLVASENLFVTWLVLGLWLSMRPWSRPRHAAWAGAALALATLTRAVALVLPVVVLLWKRSGVAEPHRWRTYMAAMLVAFGLLVLPWSVRNWVVLGEPALVSHGGGLNFYFGHNEHEPVFREVSQTPMAGLRTPGEIDRRGWQLGMRHALRDPIGLLGRSAYKLRALFASPGYALQANNAVRRPEGWQYDPVIAALAEEARDRQRGRARLLRSVFSKLAALHTRILWLGALGALFLWRRFTPGMRLIAWVGVYWVGAHIVFWAQPRFRYALEVPMAILASFALITLFAALRERWRRRTAGATSS
jgi:4-amino-4-deoxy-L-arabinose transferase-like glycosyltransferase